MTINVLMSIFLYLATFQFTVAQGTFTVNGSTVQLICPDKGNSMKWINWLKTDRTSIIAYTSATSIDNRLDADLHSRLQVTGNQSLGEYHLNISNVRKSDEGNYICRLSGTSGEGSTQQLTVIIGPTSVYIENITPDNKIPGIEGQDMTIKCTAIGGQPPPDIKLLILGSNYNGSGSAQHTFRPHSSGDGSTVTCQAGYNQINFNPLSTSAYIHLMLKPVIVPFVSNALSTEENTVFNKLCQTVGSRPAASMHWLLGQQNITSNSTSQTNEQSSTDKYTVTSNLRYRVDRRYNGQTLICRASNVAGYTETSLTLNVKYAPGVIVENKTLTQTQSSRQIHSTIESNPPVNTCTWRHKSKYGEHIRGFSNNNQTLTLPTVPEDKRYQDTGEYICTADNGIVGINGQLKQTGSGYLISNGPPVITSDNKDSTKQYGKFGEDTKIYVNVYSIPKYSSISWYIGNSQLVSNKYVTKDEPAIVKDRFHGVEVQLVGYRVTLTIRDLQKKDFTNYSLRLYYSNQYVGYEVILESSSGPETPSNFTITSSSETSITVQWIPGFDGGHTQKFCIEYRVIGTNAWMLQETKTSDLKKGTHNTYTLSGLKDKTTYKLRLYAQNAFNQSKKTDTATTTTQQSEAQTSSNAIIGSVAALVVVLLVVFAIIISILIFKKRKAGMIQTEKNAGFYENCGFQNVQIGDEYDEVVRKSDTQQKETSKTYESLGTKNAVDVYDDLNNRKGLSSSKPSVDHYEAFSATDKPNIFEELENKQGQTEKVYVNETF